jgi:hypothetical protein
MLYNQPYGVSDPDAPYINGNPSTGTMGSIPPAASIEYPQREIVNFETDSGLAPSNSDLHQLSKSVQSGAVNFAPDVGTVNQVQMTLMPVPTLIGGLAVRTLIAVSNTGDSTLNLNALGPKPIVRRGGTKLLAADLLANTMAMFIYNEVFNYWELYGGTSTAAAGGQLHANLDIYVNGAIGDDANDGTANTVGHALKTIQGGINLAFNYAPSQYNITVHVAAGSYVSAATPSYAGPTLIISGAGVGSCTVNGGSGTCFQATGPNVVTISGFTCQSNGVNYSGQHFMVGAGATMNVSGCASNSTGGPGGPGGAAFQAYGGYLNVNGHTFNGGWIVAAFWANFNGSIGINGTISITGSLTIGEAFCWVSAGGAIAVNTSVYPTFPGAGNVSGPKFYAAGNGTINTTGAGLNYFPGNSPGFIDTGGQYN